MRSTLLILFLLFIIKPLAAQVVITPGALLYIDNNGVLTLNNTSLVNNGSFLATNSLVIFTGTANSTIGGAQPVNFYGLQIDKQPGSSVVLQRDVSVFQRVIFTSGFLNLGNSNLDLDTTGLLSGEQEISRITTNGTGEVIFTTKLNAPSGANPANLGAIITSSQNLGNVVIRRGHLQQTNSAGQGTSVRRYYDITPANNSNLNATFRFQYFDGELNSLDENLLVLFSSKNGTGWTPQGFTTRNKTENWVEKTGINSIHRYTLSSAGNALPVKFILFNVKCNGDKGIISWRTAQEQNAHHFDVQRSADGILWTVINTMPASGNSTTEKEYAFTDNTASQNNFYRIAAYDNDGKMSYTSVLRSACGSKDVFRLWPNPSQRFVFINIVAAEASTAIIKVFDNRGALVKEQKASILQGSNQLNLDLGSLPNGVYAVHAEWNNGQMKTTTQVIKHQ